MGIDMQSEVFSYSAFLRELRLVLDNADVAPSHQPITANGNQDNKKSRLPSNQQPAVGRVIIYVEEHLTEQLSLERLAEEAQLSKYQLIRRFQNEKGTTPWKYVISRRVDKARKLLEEGQAPGQVAAEVGFYDQSHFSKSFRKETGQTPKKYQEENFKNRN